MKQLIITLIATLPSLTGFAQGTINFCNFRPGAGLNAPVFYAGVTKLSAPWLAGLYAGLASTSLAYVGNSTPFLSGAGAGYFSATVTLPGIPGGTAAWLQVWAWDPTLGGATNGATLAQAVATGMPFYGFSSAFTVVSGDPTTIPPGVPADMIGLSSFSVACLGPYFYGVQWGPQDQTVLVGTRVNFSLFVQACPPPLYQWYFNGSPIQGAVSAGYTINSVQLANAGIYSVRADSAYWNFHYTAAATLTVLAPPTLTSSPQSQTAEAGSTVGFKVQYAGSPVPGCQWFFNGNRLNDATNAFLRLPGVQPAQAGPYTVVLTNSVGAVTSPPAMLSVIVPVDWAPAPALTLIGQPGTLLNVDYADPLAGGITWQPLESVALTNPSQMFVDLAAVSVGQRVYRGWQAGAASPAPQLGLDMVPALTLTGPVSSTWRVDAINAIGPTNAWFTLDTVTLTNPSQLYLDVSSIHQPRRLWRIVPQ